MSQSEQPPSGSDFVSRLVENPANPPSNLRVLYGFSGRAQDEEYDRLYLDRGFRQWIDVLKTAIKHRESAPGGGEYLWVQETIAPTTSGLAGFFTGPMALPAPGPAPMAGGLAARAAFNTVASNCPCGATNAQIICYSNYCSQQCYSQQCYSQQCPSQACSNYCRYTDMCVTPFCNTYFVCGPR